MIITKKPLCLLVLLALMVSKNLSEKIHYQSDMAYVNILSRTAIKVIGDVESESFLTCISITTSDSRESTWQHKDIINNIAGAVANGMLIISSDDRNSTFAMGQFKERKRFNILVVDGLIGFRILANHIPNGNFNFDGKFLVIVNNVTMSYISLVKEISERFFNDYIVNIHILVPNPVSDKEVFMFTYYPYQPEKCSRCNVKLYNIFETERFRSEKAHFPNKLQTFYDFPIVVAAFNTTPFVNLVKHENGTVTMFGFEGNLFKAMAEKLNLNIKLIIPQEKWGVLYPNETLTGALALVHDNRANVTLGSFFYRYNTAEFVDLTWSYYTSYLCIVIPSGRPFTSLEKTLWPFRIEVWYTVFCIVVLKALIQIPIKIMHLNRHLNHIDFLDFVRIYLGLSITKYPTKILSKAFVVGMFFYALVLRSCYQSSLFQFVTLTVNVSTIRSVSELIEDYFRFYLIEPLNFVLESLPQIRSRSAFVTELSEHGFENNAQLNWDNKIAIITSRNHNHGLMIPIDENIYQLSIAMVLRRHSYFTEVFNEVIYKLLANGYISKLHSNFEQKNHVKRPSNTILLSINDVMGLFQICCGGYFLAMAVFGFEIVTVMLRKKKMEKRQKESLINYI